MPPGGFKCHHGRANFLQPTGGCLSAVTARREPPSCWGTWADFRQTSNPLQLDDPPKQERFRCSLTTIQQPRFFEGESYIIFPIYWLGVSFFLRGISRILMIYLRVGDWQTLLLVDAFRSNAIAGCYYCLGIWLTQMPIGDASNSDSNTAILESQWGVQHLLNQFTVSRWKLLRWWSSWFLSDHSCSLAHCQS